jgi:hypothetical protein
VRLGDTWMPLRDWQGAAALLERHGITVEEDQFEDRPAGCRFIRSYVVTLPVGAQLHCHISVPRTARRRGSCVPIGETAEGGDVARWVVANFPPAQTPLAQRNVEYRVTRSGRLVSEERWQEVRARAGGARKPPPRTRELESTSATEPSAGRVPPRHVSKAG